MADLTPYDTGDILEPTTHGTGGDNWGYVDFDDDAGSTIVTTKIVRDTDEFDTPAYVMHLAVNDAQPFTIIVNDEHVVTIHPDGTRDFNQL